MERREFMAMCSLLGLTLPFLPKEQIEECRNKWKTIGDLKLQRVEYIPDRVDRDTSEVGEDEYFSYEEYLQHCLDNRESWQEPKLPAEEWIKKYVLKKERHQYYRVFEDGVPVGRLIFHIDTKVIQFDCYVLDDLMTLKNWCDVEPNFEECFSDPEKTAKTCVVWFREKAKEVLDKIIQYYNLRKVDKV